MMLLDPEEGGWYCTFCGEWVYEDLVDDQIDETE
jgi:hypothetical protein